ncbi:hypothetical protein MRS44_013902 [Fusarium solani]|uniref:uncharacterized protein n=1 Tax=Fusarium solani TaxID=169388 RepID=UPI0032C40C27|nr:hypothetical protein MRS44_018389 [Fusarium solani]KAJ3455302.1 hypothetical protein MRS44_013902 [Fusarium solani]
MRSSQSAPQEVALRHRRLSATGLSTESINTIKAIEDKAEKTLLLLWDDLPPGAATTPSFTLPIAKSALPTCTRCAPSSIYTMNPQEVARWGNKLDYTGIVVLIVGSFVPALYYGFFCKPTLLTAYLCLICLLGTGCAVVSWAEQFRTSKWRPYRAMMFIGLGLSGFIPVIHGITIYGYKGLENRMSVTRIIIHGAMYIFGAALYAARWPERSFPGAFDIWGSSHQIFHMFVLLAAATHFYGMAKAFDYHHTVLGSQCLTA